MERDRLTHLLKAPGQVAREDLADLHSLAERYPWFSGAQVLRASGEGLVGDVRSDETLASAAAHIPSRAVLYDLAASRLHDTSAPAPLSVVTTDKERPATFFVGSPLPTVVIAPEVVAEPVPMPMHETTEHPQLGSTSLPAPEVKADQAVIAPSPEPELVPVSEADDPLERQIIEAALASAYDLSLHAPPPTVAQVPVVEVHAHGPSVAPTSDPQATETGSTSEEEFANAPGTSGHPVAPKPITRNTRKRFSSWLDQDVADARPAEKKKTPLHPASDLPSPTVPDTSGATTPKPLAPEERMSIVDRFIGQEIQAPATKAAFFTPQHAAKRSLDDTAGLVTETLARIYAKQGSTAKAIEAYNKLALKYPEKSAYFAGLSQALEAQQNK